MSLTCFNDSKWRKLHKKNKPRKERFVRILKEPFSVWVWHFNVNKRVLSQSSMRSVTDQYFKWIVNYVPNCRLCPHKESWRHLATIIMKRTHIPYIDIATYK